MSGLVNYVFDWWPSISKDLIIIGVREKGSCIFKARIGVYVLLVAIIFTVYSS